MATYIARLDLVEDRLELSIEHEDHAQHLGDVHPGDSGEGMFDEAERLLHEYGFTPANGRWVWHDIRGSYVAVAAKSPA